MSLSPYLPQGGKFLPFPVLQLLQNQHSLPPPPWGRALTRERDGIQVALSVCVSPGLSPDPAAFKLAPPAPLA